MRRPADPLHTPRHGVARVLSKLGICSRSEAARRVAEGRVRVNGRIVRDPEHPVRQGVDRVELDAEATAAAQRVHLLLNKPRGLVTTTRDEQGRDTVYRCLDGAGLPWVAPVGRLDKASEGLLLFTNDPEWSARVLDPQTGPDKTYHVQIDRVPDAGLLARMEQGVDADGERLAAKSARLLRHGDRTAWLEIVLDEGRNRQIRRLLETLDVGVLRLVRVAIGDVVLGALAKGQWRLLTEEEVGRLSG